MALTAQPRAKLVNAITSFPSVAKGTDEGTRGEIEMEGAKSWSLAQLYEIQTRPELD